MDSVHVINHKTEVYMYGPWHAMCKARDSTGTGSADDGFNKRVAVVLTM